MQDVLGTLVMLELEAMGIERVKVGLAAQYIDHNLVQNDHMNADEHLFLRSACRHFGVWYSRPGNGISHPAGARVMPFWSNIPKTSEFTFEPVDDAYPRRARENRVGNGHVIVAGNNYGQGSSRENAALAPRFLGLRVVMARSFARIHWQNLINFGVLPLTFINPGDYDRLNLGDVIRLAGVHTTLRSRKKEFQASFGDGDNTIVLRHELSQRQVDLLLSGGVINWLRERLALDEGLEERGERARVLNPG